MMHKSNDISPIIELSSLDYFSPFVGLKAKVVHTQSQTIAFWEIEKGAILPLHRHIHQQVTIVTKGVLELTIGSETKKMSKGMVAIIPSNVDHKATAITEVEVTDVFYPIREDFPNLNN